MKKSPIEAILGFAVVAFTIFFLAFAAFKIDVGKIDGYPVNAKFSKVGGLEMGADVVINGIKVGSVVDVYLDDEYSANVKMMIKHNISLPVDTIAVIADAGLMGAKYIRLDPGMDKQRVQKNGGGIVKTKDYRSFEDNVSEFIFLSVKDDQK